MCEKNDKNKGNVDSPKPQSEEIVLIPPTPVKSQYDLNEGNKDRKKP